MNDTEQKTPAPIIPIGIEDSPRGTNVHIVKAVLEFISKCFYPGIVIILIFLLKPTFEQVDLKALVERLQSAKAGDYEFAFSQAQDVGAQTAPLNSKVAELERTLATLQSDIVLLQKKVVPAQINEADGKARETAESMFKENSKFTVLVFHRGESRTSGQTITNALLKAGFQSSDTETNFSELRKVQPTPGIIFITYNSTGERILPEIKKLIDSLGLPSEVKLNPRAIDLRRGDVQVMTF